MTAKHYVGIKIRWDVSKEIAKYKTEVGAKDYSDAIMTAIRKARKCGQ